MDGDEEEAQEIDDVSQRRRGGVEALVRDFVLSWFCWNGINRTGIALFGRGAVLGSLRRRVEVFGGR